MSSVLQLRKTNLHLCCLMRLKSKDSSTPVDERRVVRGQDEALAPRVCLTSHLQGERQTPPLLYPEMKMAAAGATSQAFVSASCSVFFAL